MISQPCMQSPPEGIGRSRGDTNIAVNAASTVTPISALHWDINLSATAWQFYPITAVSGAYERKLPNDKDLI